MELAGTAREADGNPTRAASAADYKRCNNCREALPLTPAGTVDIHAMRVHKARCTGVEPQEADAWERRDLAMEVQDTFAALRRDRKLTWRGYWASAI